MSECRNIKCDEEACAGYNDNYCSSTCQIMSLMRDNLKLRVALSYYADKEQWYKARGHSPWNLEFDSSHRDGDGWLTAKEALEATK